MALWSFACNFIAYIIFIVISMFWVSAIFKLSIILILYKVHGSKWRRFFMDIGNMIFQMAWIWKWFVTSVTKVINNQLIMNAFDMFSELGFLKEGLLTWATIVHQVLNYRIIFRVVGIMYIFDMCLQVSWSRKCFVTWVTKVGIIFWIG